MASCHLGTQAESSYGSQRYIFGKIYLVYHVYTQYNLLGAGALVGNRLYRKNEEFTTYLASGHGVFNNNKNLV